MPFLSRMPVMCHALPVSLAVCRNQGPGCAHDANACDMLALCLHSTAMQKAQAAGWVFGVRLYALAWTQEMHTTDCTSL